MKAERVLVIGYEGVWRPSLGVSWGAAALEVDGSVVNGATWLSRPSEKAGVAALEEAGTLVRFAAPIQVNPKRVNARKVVTVFDVSIDSPIYQIMASPRPHQPGLVTTVDVEKRRVFVFNDQKYSDAFRRNAVDLAVRNIFDSAGFADDLLETEAETKQRENLLRAATVLDAHDPVLNAVRVVRAPEQLQPALREVALSCMRSDEAKAEFLQMAEAYAGALKGVYEVEYKGQSATDGMESDTLAGVLTEFTAANRDSADDLARELPFLGVPRHALHVNEMRGNSATLRFVTKVKGDTLGQSILRYLALTRIQKLLSGEVEPRTKRVLKAVERISTLDDATFVMHRPMGTDELVPLGTHPKEAATSRARDEELALLGYQTGLLNEAKTIEVSLFPGFTIRRLSAVDNGSGAEPVGVSFRTVNANKFLNVPMIYRLRRVVDEEGGLKFHLLEVQDLDGKQRIINAAPSTVVSGAFVCRLQWRVRVRRGHLDVSDSSVSPVRDPSFENAMEWLRSYAVYCRREELANLRPVRIPPAGTQFKITSLQRVILALEAFHGTASLAALTKWISEQFNEALSETAVKSAIGYEPDLVRIDEAAHDQPAKLTSEGRKYLAAFKIIQKRFG